MAKVMNNLPLDISVQIYSYLSNQELRELTSTALWRNVSALLSSETYNRTFWKMRVAHLSQEDGLAPDSLDVDWKLIHSFVVSHREVVQAGLIEHLSECDYDLADYSYRHDALKLAIEADNVRAVSLLLQAGSGDRESLIEMTSDAIEARDKTRMTSLLVEHLGDPTITRRLQQVSRESNCAFGVSLIFILLSVVLLVFGLLYRQQQRV
ncbi:Hypothetical protein POVR2_LOCUS289 [uncultured virus]|nr:Hypothetical protein POVR2_LOCUS289 [uncultured virus]